MIKHAKLKVAVLAGAVATAMAIPAIAEHLEQTTYYEVTSPAVAQETVTTTTYVEPTSLSSNETVVEPVVTETTTTTTAAYVPAPAIEVTAPPLTEDQAINRDVVERLAQNSRLTGKIGVETKDREVKLTGIVTTRGQAILAGREASSVQNVRYVDNQIRNKVGGYY